jgi:chaperone required for assembly of F1-ATPase
MIRFWQIAECVPDDGAWSVRLDAKPLHIPGGVRLRLPTAALGDAVAAEWQAAGGAKGGQTSYDDLPLTRLSGTWQERVDPDPEPTALGICRYGETDLLCYRAATPEALVHRESEAWDPWLGWLLRTHGAALRVTTGVLHIAQDADALAALAAAVEAQPTPVLAALGVAVPALGSAVLGLAMAEGALAPDVAYDLSVLDDTYQAELWGHDAEAQARAARVRADVLLAGRFIALTRP